MIELSMQQLNGIIKNAQQMVEDSFGLPAPACKYRTETMQPDGRTEYTCHHPTCPIDSGESISISECSQCPYTSSSDDGFQLMAYLYKNKSGTLVANVDTFADYLMENNEFRTIFWQKGETIYLFENGVWLPNGKKRIQEEAERRLKTYAKNGFVDELISKIKRRTPINLDEFQKTPDGLVCVENGIIDIKTGNFFKHSPKYYFKTKLPVRFDPSADCPAIKKFFEEVLYESDIPLMQEWIGFLLSTRYFEKKAMILFGTKNTGKTITLNLLSSFIGEGNKADLSLHSIGSGNSFDLLALKDKFVNIYDDLSSKDLSDVGGFKIATGGGYVSGEFKFGDRIGFKSYAKLMFATNKIPAIKEDVEKESYYCRWLPMRFDNQFSEEEIDNQLIGKLTTPQELSGLLNWALEGFKRLLQNRRFSFNMTLSDVEGIMQRSSHPLSAFGHECLEYAENFWVSKEEMYRKYVDWCVRKNQTQISKEKLGRQLGRFVLYLADGRDKEGSERGWRNYRFKGEMMQNERI